MNEYFNEAPMAIAFAKIEFAGRASGKNACCKSAYNGRSKVSFQGHKFQEKFVYNFSHRKAPEYHEILLPEYVDKSFKSAEVLWNAVELKELRKNSQVALDFVAALPDDAIVSLQDKINLARTYLLKYYVSEGLAVQLDIHGPDGNISFSPDSEEKEIFSHNWHVHGLISTRRFTSDGKAFSDAKARDLMPEVRLGMVVSAEQNGERWRNHQNEYFEEHGIPLRVDQTGIIPQIHIGPSRMRGRAFDLIEENEFRIDLNREEAKDPEKILKKITENKNIFTREDVDQFLEKHVDFSDIKIVRERFWKQKEIVELIDPAYTKNDMELGKFTTGAIISEEKRAIDLADKIHEKKALFLRKLPSSEEYTRNLTEEQKKAYRSIISGKKLCCIGGYAGTGKSYLLSSLRKAYEDSGYKVRAFGPDSTTTNILKENGFSLAENLHRFLFSHSKEIENPKKFSFSKNTINNGKEIWIIDEAGKIGNRPMVQLLRFARHFDVQVVFSGDQSQLTPVERGFLYHAFCERYGSQDLLEIKRQNKEIDRSIAYEIATGDISQAIDRIIQTGGISWQDDRTGAMESLIKLWAIDREIFPNCTSAIIAYSNSERASLNELVRLYRKEKGEVSDKEYRCENSTGVFYASEGDEILFKANDKSLSVSNGTTGTLVKASENQFVVSVKDSKVHTREISFDPTKYSSFQLGYITTLNGSQGKTIDRAYVLHSPRLNKAGFYVSLTRHVKKVHIVASKDSLHYYSYLKAKAFGYREKYTCFLKENELFKGKSQEEYVVDLKEQLSVENKKELTSQYTTAVQQNIVNLQNSDSMTSQAKGHALSVWNQMAGWISGKLDHKKSDGEFFNPIIKEKGEGTVNKIFTHDRFADSTNDHLDSKSIVMNTLSTVKNIHDIKICGNPTKKQSNFARGINHQAVEKLSISQRDFINTYFEVNAEAADLSTIAKIESETLNKSIDGTPQFKEWMKVCLKRNELAYKVIKSISKDNLLRIFGKSGSNFLFERSQKHVSAIARDQNKPVDIETQLQQNIESVLYKLFPEGPSGRDRNGLRFGSKGSLSVRCSGEKIGTFYDHENKIGGGLIGLIQKTLNLSFMESKEWAKRCITGSENIFVPSHFIIKRSKEEETDWISSKPNRETPAPSLGMVNKWLGCHYNEVARHLYADEKGETLFYILRLVNKLDSTKKRIFPLSYGSEKENQNKRWAIRAYQSDHRTLYNLSGLHKNPSSMVLVVEGEKTADAANKQFFGQDMVCITWSGGAGAVLKTDWTPLFNRQVVIWPDNDEAGFKASVTLSTELRKVGVKSLHVVDKNVLSKEFPAKWDLADPFPEVNHSPKELILTAKEQSIGSDQLNLSNFQNDRSDEAIVKLQANDILFRIEERIRGPLEEKYGVKTWEIKNEIQQEFLTVLKDKALFEKDLAKSGVSSGLARRIAYQASIIKAETGKGISRSNMQDIQRILSQINTTGDSFSSYALDKSITPILSGVYGKDALNHIEKSVKHQSKFVEQQILQSKMLEHEILISTEKKVDLQMSL